MEYCLMTLSYLVYGYGGYSDIIITIIIIISVIRQRSIIVYLKYSTHLERPREIMKTVTKQAC